FATHSLLADERVLEKGNVRLSYDERGISGLFNLNDPFGAGMVARGQRLRLIAKYRTTGGEGQDLAVLEPQSATSAGGHAVSHTIGTTNSPLRVSQIFRTDGTTLDWDIELEVATNSAVEIGDLAINIPAPGPRGEEPKEIFEKGFVRHQFISG